MIADASGVHNWQQIEMWGEHVTSQNASNTFQRIIWLGRIKPGRERKATVELQPSLGQAKQSRGQRRELERCDRGVSHHGIPSRRPGNEKVFR